MAATILVLNGPNLNLLGSREPEVYGTRTLADIEAACRERGDALGVGIVFRQTNHEGELVDWIQQARGQADAIAINPAALTHTSIAVSDALSAVGLPVAEVHLSNIFKREPWRRHSYVSPAAVGMVCGFGGTGYVLAIEALARIINERSGE